MGDNASPAGPFDHALENAGEVASPALLIYPDRAAENVRRMLALAGSPDRLRPHVKTHKLPELVRLQLDAGVTRFKCATVAEAEMLAAGGAPDVLLALQPVGPQVARLRRLADRYPGTAFSAIADDAAVLEHLSSAFADAPAPLGVMVDLDCGMHRTGIVPGAGAAELYRRISTSPGLAPRGLHAYDGHLRDPDRVRRSADVAAAFAPVFALHDQLRAGGFEVAEIVAGGTPTFPVHAADPRVLCSPGTCVLWDGGYAAGLPDLDFEHAALLLARVVSAPGEDRLCLDLGHKAVAAENPLHRRVSLLGLPGAEPLSQSEEHLVVRTPTPRPAAVGDVVYGLPWHICPTVALHAEAVVVRAGRAEARWPVAARARSLGV